MRTIGSIPIYLLKEDLPKRAMSLTRSVKRSGMVFKRSPLLMRFLSIWIKRVGKELDLVISWFGSSDLPRVKTLARTFKPD